MAKKGKNMLLSIGGTIYGFATDCSVNFTSDTAETTSTKYKHRDSAGDWKEYESGSKGVTLSSGYVLSDSLEDYKALWNEWVAGKAIEVSFIEVVNKTTEETGKTGDFEEATNGLKHAGQAYITGIDLNAPTEGEVTFNINLQGTGVWTCE